eukprot:3397541-Heterocapsa_arctica.AAC.1
MSNDSPKGPVTPSPVGHIPAVTGAHRCLPALCGGSGRPLIRILSRTAGLNNKSNICNGCKHL